MSDKKTATRPLHAVVGATDLVVKHARNYGADVQARLADVQSRVSRIELEPKALRDQARTLVISGIDGVNGEVKDARASVESRAKEARTQVEGYVNGAVAEATETYGDLAARGRKLLERVRNQQTTHDAQAAAQTTVAKAKTARTQTTKSAKATTSTAKTAAKSTARKTSQSAKKTAGTAKSNAKATSTSAQKTAATTANAAGDAAEKVGD
jgi:heparin binding hemagglutinin HbhA